MPHYFRVLAYVKPYWRFMAGAAGCMIVFAVMSSMTVWIALPLLQTLFGADDLQTSAAVAATPAERLQESTGLTGLRESLKQMTNDIIVGDSKMETLETLCLVIFIVLVMKNISGYLQAYLMAFAENGVIKDLRNALYRHLHRLSLAYFHRERTGELISRVTYDVMQINGAVSAAFGTLIKEPLLVLLHLVIIVILSWQLTLATFVLLPFSLVAIGLVGRRLRRSSTVSQESMADLTSTLQETVSGIRVVKAFAMESFETAKFVKQTEHYFRTLLRMTRIRNLASPVTEILGGVVGLAILWYGGTKVISGALLAPEDFLTFLLAMFSMLKPLKELGQVNNRIQEGMAAADRVFSILDTSPDVVDATDAVSIDGVRKDIHFDHVSFRYDEGSQVLHDINLTVPAGDVVAVVGPSGGGKSTLVDLVARFYDPTHGAILIDGTDLRSLTLSSVRGNMGIVTQEVILFNDTVRNNIAYGMDEIPLEQVVAAAVAANADTFVQQLDSGYDTLLGERGVRLSGGQRQRIAIARAILKDPEILIFDEATSALDTESELLVQEAIDRLMKGRTAFVIAHRLSTIQNADRVVVVDDGRIVQSGTHAILLREPGLYRKLHDLQFQDEAPDARGK